MQEEKFAISRFINSIQKDDGKKGTLIHQKDFSICLITKSMEENRDNSSVQEQGCKSLLHMLIKYKSSKESVAGSGAISSIFSAMMMHPNHEKVQQFGCATLAEICFISEQDKSIISQSGAIPLALAAMKRHPYDAKVYKQACSLLGNLSTGNPTNCSSIHANNGIGLILKSMELHFQNDGVQEKACYALSAICRKNKAIINTIRNGGGLYLASEAMKANPKNKKVVAQVCNLFSSLAYDMKSKHAITNGEAISLIFNSLKNHFDDKLVVKKSLAAFCHLSLCGHYHIHNQSSFLEASKSSSSSISSNTEFCNNIVNSGVIQFIPEVLRRYSNNVEIQKYAYLFLRNVSCNAKGVKVLEEMDSRNTLFNRKEYNHPSCQQYAQDTLQNMDSNSI